VQSIEPYELLAQPECLGAHRIALQGHLHLARALLEEAQVTLPLGQLLQ